MTESITKKIAEELIRLNCEYKAKYDILMSMSLTSTNYFWAKDLAGNYLHANRSCIELLGEKTLEDVVGHPDMYFAFKNKALKPADADFHTFGEACGNSDEITLQKNTACKFFEDGNIRGEYHSWDIGKAPLIDSDTGDVIGTVGNAVDITNIVAIQDEAIKQLRDWAAEEKDNITPELHEKLAFISRAFSATLGETINGEKYRQGSPL